jgi:hypothetical protein
MILKFNIQKIVHFVMGKSFLVFNLIFFSQ